MARSRSEVVFCVQVEKLLVSLVFFSSLVLNNSAKAEENASCYTDFLSVHITIDGRIIYNNNAKYLNDSMSQCGGVDYSSKIFYPFTFRTLRDKCPGYNFNTSFELDCDNTTGNIYLNNTGVDKESSVFQILAAYPDHLIVNVSKFRVQASSSDRSFWSSSSPIKLPPPFLVSRLLTANGEPLNMLGLFNSGSAVEASVIIADRQLGSYYPIVSTRNTTSCLSSADNQDHCINVDAKLPCSCTSSLPLIRATSNDHYIRYISYKLLNIDTPTKNITFGAYVSLCVSNRLSNYSSNYGWYSDDIMVITWEVDSSSGCRNVVSKSSIPADECECLDVGQYFNGSACAGNLVTSWPDAFDLSSSIVIIPGLEYGGIGVVAILYLLVCSLARIVHLMRERKRRKYFNQNGGIQIQNYITSRGRHASRFFTEMELREATNNYSQNMKLGEGGFGTVYKGCLKDGTLVAIKKAKLRHNDDNEQFLNELAILMSIHHKHIVKLLGCCLETEVPHLVYEYVSNGNLSDWLHTKNEIGDCKLGWIERLKVATQIAEALAYLHGSASPPILHRDVKSTNVLLDERMDAQVADFGLARLVPNVATHVSTLVKGTIGYLDPEYFQTLKLTDKSDVYSFGVILLEMVTSLKPLNCNRQEDIVESRPYSSLSLLFIDYMQEGKVEDLFDYRLENPSSNLEHVRDPKCIHSSIMAVAKLAYCCLAQASTNRPKMILVADQLKHIMSCLQNNNEYTNVVSFSTPGRMTLNDILSINEVSTNYSFHGHDETSLTMPR